MKNINNSNVNTQKDADVEYLKMHGILGMEEKLKVNVTAQFEVKPLTKKVRQFLENKADYFIENMRRRNKYNPFSKFDTYEEEDSKTGGFIYWKPIPAMIQNIKRKEKLINKHVYMLNRKWLVTENSNGLICFVQGIPSKKEVDTAKLTPEQHNEMLRHEFSKQEKIEIKIKLPKELIYDALEKEALDITNYFDLSDAFIDSGVNAGIRQFFNTSTQTFEALFNEFDIKVADNELTRETEALYSDKKNNITWAMTQDELMNLVHHTGIFKTGKHSNKNLDAHLIEKCFNKAKGSLARENRYNPVKTLFDNAFLNKKPTLDTSMIDQVINCFEINDGDEIEYNKACKSAIKKFFISGVAAIYQPVFNSRLAPIFVSRQGHGKSAIGSKIFGVVKNAFKTIDGFDAKEKNDREKLFRFWVSELAEPDKNFKTKDRIDAYKSLTNSELTDKRKYENDMTTFMRHSIHFLTMNNICIRDDQSTRNPIIRLKSIDLAQIDKILGLNHLGGGIVEVDPQYPDKRLEFWHQIKCCYDRGETFDLDENELSIFQKYLNKNNQKNSMTITFEEMFGIGENFDYNTFLSEVDNGARYQVTNCKVICEKMAELDSTMDKKYAARDYDKQTSEIYLLIKRYFPDCIIKSLRCPIVRKKMKGFKTPVILTRAEQEELQSRRDINLNQNNITVLTEATIESEPDNPDNKYEASSKSMYTQEELQNIAEEDSHSW